MQNINNDYDQLMELSYTDDSPNSRVGTPYIHTPNLFTHEECDKINELFDSYKSVVGGVGKVLPDGKIIEVLNYDLRKVNVQYVNKNDGNIWCHDRIESLTNKLNDENWRCDITDYSQPMRRLVYSPTDHFNSWHPDYGIAPTCYRKLTTVVLLDDPCNFTGGEFQIGFWGTIPLKKGDAITFPCYIYHRVTPITSGLRRTLVHRAIGPHFK